MQHPARVAIYFAPTPDDALAQAGAAWLGRDAETGLARVQPNLPDIAKVTKDARLYGFHATLKPPMRLSEGHTWDDLLQAADSMAACVAPFDLPALTVAEPEGFLALRETAPCPALQALADLCVASLDHLRAPPSAEELARRQRAHHSPAQKALLDRWGYPYVFGAWYFHMTLSQRLSDQQRDFWRPAAEVFFADALRAPRRVNDICLFTQPAPGQPFTIGARMKLRG